VLSLREAGLPVALASVTT